MTPFKLTLSTVAAVAAFFAAGAASAQSGGDGPYSNLIERLRCQPGMACMVDAETAAAEEADTSAGGFFRSFVFRRDNAGRAATAIPATMEEASEAMMEMADDGALPSAEVEVFFAFDSAEITDETVESLEAIGRALNDPALSRSAFLLIGHTDAAGTDAYNQDLSERRSQAVRNYLVGAFAIDPARLEATGVGERRLADPQNPRSGVNRRVQIINFRTAAQ